MGDKRSDALFHKRRNGYWTLSETEQEAMKGYCEGYKLFLDKGRTEREVVRYTVELAEARGYRPFRRGEPLKPGDKVYRVNRGKAIMLAVIGKESLEKGINIGAAHIDSPRLDLKPNPLIQEGDFALLKTHYYGGIRKYQWVSIPLELRGVVAKKDGSVVEVQIGGQPGDPVLTIPDLLPHLADKQAKEPLWQAIKGEDLNIMVGSRPYSDEEEKDPVKLMVLDILNEKYGIVEEDFISAELCATPAFPTADVGLDRSMIGAYGQDDRVCGYAALKGLFDAEEKLKRTGVCMLADKEEIGSEGVTGMQSWAFDTFVSDLCDSQGVALKTCYENSFCLSADVTAAFDPNYASVYEKHNAGYLNWGVSLCKYTGARGKSGASDASAEVVAYVRKVLDEAGVLWHLAELGKVDAGGGGTVAHFMANRNIDTLDAGTPVLAMHSPFEVTGKLDCYMTYKGMKAIFEA